MKHYFTHRYPTELPSTCNPTRIFENNYYLVTDSNQDALEQAKKNGASVEMYNIQSRREDGGWTFCHAWNES